jgi:hypothetical protein
MVYNPAFVIQTNAQIFSLYNLSVATTIPLSYLAHLGLFRQFRINALPMLHAYIHCLDLFVFNMIPMMVPTGLVSGISFHV